MYVCHNPCLCHDRAPGLAHDYAPSCRKRSFYRECADCVQMARPPQRHDDDDEMIAPNLEDDHVHHSPTPREAPCDDAHWQNYRLQTLREAFPINIL